MQSINSLITKGTGLRQIQPAEALKCFRKSLKLSLATNDSENEALSYFNIAISNLNLPDYPESIKNFYNALDCSFVEANPQLKAEVYRGIATNYLRTYKYRDALKYLYLSEQISIETGNLVNLHMVYGSLGSLYDRLKLYKKALHYCLRSLEIAEETEDEYLKQYSMMSIGACYYHLGNFKSANKYLNYSLGNKLNIFAEVNSLHFLSIIKLSEKDTKTASEYSKRQIRLSRDNNYIEYEALGYKLLGEIAFNGKDFDMAVRQFSKGLALLKRTGEKLISFSIRKQLLSSFEKTGKRNDLHKMYKELYIDHINHLEEETKLKIEQIDIEYENEKIKKEIEEEKAANSRLKKALEEVNDLNIRLEKMHNEKNDFLAMVVHDLKNPVQNIRSLLRMMENENNEKDNTKKFSRDIKDQTERMFNLISRLLDYKVIDEGKKKIKKTVFKPEDICKEILNNMSILAGNKNQKLEFVNGSAGSKIKTDYIILYQALENLVSNAIKFTPKSKNISLCTFSQNGDVRIEVNDEGPGFTERDRANLFVDFAKLSAQPTSNEQSTGLGLSITKKLCSLIGAGIELTHTSEKGSVFSITLKHL